MKVLLVEYAMAIGMHGTHLLEGRAMLNTLVTSFVKCGHDVTYLTSGEILNVGNAVVSTQNNFSSILKNEAKRSDVWLIIAPDEILGDLTSIIEHVTYNLGSSAEVAQLCADKLKCTEILLQNNIPAPKIIENTTGIKCVIKPRFGCASEETFISTGHLIPEGSIATEFIDGTDVSVSVIAGDNPLVLCVNKQSITVNQNKNQSQIIEYKGNTVCFSPPYKEEIIKTAINTCKLLGCRGYTGIDLVYNGIPYVIDVNSRPTTSLYGICKVMDEEIADLLLKNIFGKLPDVVHIIGEYTFTKGDIN